MKLTPWFPSDTTPRRVGFYDTRVSCNTFIRARNGVGGFYLKPVKSYQIRLYWNGRFWLAAKQSQPYTAGLFQQRREWRGVYR